MSVNWVLESFSKSICFSSPYPPSSSPPSSSNSWAICLSSLSISSSDWCKIFALKPLFWVVFTYHIFHISCNSHSLCHYFVHFLFCIIMIRIKWIMNFILIFPIMRSHNIFQYQLSLHDIIESNWKSCLQFFE